MRGAATLNERSPPYFDFDFGTFNMFLDKYLRRLSFPNGVKSSARYYTQHYTLYSIDVSMFYAVRYIHYSLPTFTDADPQI